MVSVDAKKLLRCAYPEKFGMHRIATFGDYRDRIEDIATFLGFTVIEEDV